MLSGRLDHLAEPDASLSEARRLGPMARPRLVVAQSPSKVFVVGERRDASNDRPVVPEADVSNDLVGLLRPTLRDFESGADR